MVEKRRFVKCYRFGCNFYVWESIDENGNSELLTGCDRIYESSGGKPPRCDGRNEFGAPCPYAIRDDRFPDR